ncbi:MAG: FAD-dependent oxidoreductase [Candidatus Krumholzibacteria bacterium]|nr:FAD-dependent oxidoreductase [Candidatus Krumholzibacteria bacterium]
MSEPSIVVLGAGAAGLKAAARARRLLPAAHVTVVDRCETIPCGACGLPLYLGGEIDSLDPLCRTSYGALRDPDFFRLTKDITVLTGRRIVALDRDASAVTVEQTGDGSERVMLMYDKLVYALGARPWMPASVERGPAVLALTTAAAASELRRDLQNGAVTSCAVLGGGCAGVEIAAALADLWGCEVTLLEAEDRLLPRLLDADLSGIVAAELARAGVRVRTGCAVTAAATAGGHAVVTTSEGSLTVDRAVVALGTAPRGELARAAGLAVGALGGLVVDANLRTSDPAILAAGDCIELVHHTSGEVCRMPVGSLASRQGRVAGDALAGLDTEFPAVVGSLAIKVLNLNIAATGLTAAAAQAAGLDPVATLGSFDDRLHIHPDRSLIHLALVHEAGSDRLLGLQAVGPGDAVKRVDVFASLLRQDGDLADLLDAEFCFAPAYNTLLDPLHDLAAAALDPRVFGIEQAPLRGAAAGRLLLDVRTTAEYAAGASCLPPGSIHIPLAELRSRAHELPPGQPLLIACAKGSRSFEAARILRECGFTDLVYLAGGIALWGGAAPASRNR